MLVKLALGAGLAASGLSGVRAAPWGHSFAFAQAWANHRQHDGTNLPAREIERRVIPQMGGAQYLGFVYDPETNIYTLKFLRNGSVIWVDVDGRTGRIVRKSGN